MQGWTKVGVTNGSVTGLSVMLEPGDANNDNFCRATDFGLLVGSYNQQGDL